MKIELLTFANKYYRKSLDRFRRQAEQSYIFDKISVYTEKDLSPTFVKLNKSLLKPSCRGFGYWIWKPDVILQTLENSSADIIVYCDAGFHLNSNGFDRAHEYFEALSASHKDFCVFSGKPSDRVDLAGAKYLKLYDKYYTKQYTINRLSIPENHLESDTIAAGLIIMKRNAITRGFMDNWREIMSSDHTLINDQYDFSPYEGYIEHRHDQAIFSHLMKKSNNYLDFSIDEFDWLDNNSGRPNWSKLENYPFHARRDIQKYIWDKVAAQFGKLLS